MTEQLKVAVDLASLELPEQEEEEEWDAIVNRPGFLEKLEKLMQESLASGLEDGGFCL